MLSSDILEVINKIAKDDPRFDREAYLFVREALNHTVKMLDKPSRGPDRHVTGSELLEGIRNFALEEFGPMSMTVFKEWGIGKTEDFGDIVFNLVNAGILGKTDADRKEDFSGGYDFFEAFAKPFLSSREVARGGRRKSGRRRKPSTRNKT